MTIKAHGLLFATQEDADAWGESNREYAALLEEKRQKAQMITITRFDLARMILGDEEFNRLGPEGACNMMASWTMDDYRKLPTDKQRVMNSLAMPRADYDKHKQAMTQALKTEPKSETKTPD